MPLSDRPTAAHEKHNTADEVSKEPQSHVLTEEKANAPDNRPIRAEEATKDPSVSVDDVLADSGSQRGLNDAAQRMKKLGLSSERAHEGSRTPPLPQAKDAVGQATSENGANQTTYLDPTPTTPVSSSRAPSPILSTEVDERAKGDTMVNGTSEESTTSEIQSIIDQFDSGNHDSSGEVLSPRLESAASMLGGSVQHPPRKSSLEPMNRTNTTLAKGDLGDSKPMPDPKNVPLLYTDAGSPSQDKTPSSRSFSTPQSTRFADQANYTPSPQSSISGPRQQPPEPEPEPEVPFDFHRFLEQLRHRTADPVAKFLRSFLLEFGKKQWMVHEQVKIISDFLTFIAGRMAQCEVWRGVSDAEFDNAKEGMEKLVMNRLYLQTFSPAIPPPAPLASGKGTRKDPEKALGPGRKGQHQEDIERDEVLGQKVRIYRWVQEEHLDIPSLDDNGRRFMSFAQQQLLKIKMYRAPRDKVVCVLNCCKVIFGFLSTSKSADTSADSFVPLLIYVVLRANPEHLVSNVQYILRFRNQEKLGGEAGYYLSSLMGAIQFIENLDRTSLTITDEEFEKKVEASVSEIAERHEKKEEIPSSPAPPAPPPRPTHISEKSGLSEPQMIPRNSMEGEYNTPSRPLSSRGPLDRRIGTNSQDDSNAVGGLLRTIQKPLSSIGRMFTEDSSSAPFPGAQSHPLQASQSDAPRRLSPTVFQPPRRSIEETRPTQLPPHGSPRPLSAEDATARQASVEAAEAHRIQRIEHQDVVE